METSIISECHVAILDSTPSSLAADPFAEPTLGFSDPDNLPDANLPTTFRLSLEISDVANASVTRSIDTTVSSSGGGGGH